MKRRLTTLAVAVLAACHRQGDAPQAPVANAVTDAGRRGALVEAGRKVYNFRCYFCHGYSGDARTLATTYLDPPPRDFTRARVEDLPAEAIARAVRDGRPGTAMKSFRGILSDAETEAVAAFVEDEFVVRKARNTAYHTVENGWVEHDRFRAAYPFATGALPLDADPATLTPDQSEGRRLFLTSCVTCHDRARVVDEGPAWSTRPLSYPRFGFLPGEPPPQVDAITGASPYAKHDVAPKLADLSTTERRGEKLYQENCAFCHAADGTGANWIGRFMQPPARDLTQFTAETMPPARLAATIRNGIDGTSMPAWKHVLQAAQIDAVVAYVRRAFMRGKATVAAQPATAAPATPAAAKAPAAAPPT